MKEGNEMKKEQVGFNQKEKQDDMEEGVGGKPPSLYNVSYTIITPDTCDHR